jgi:hypothetical protein
MKQWFSLFIVLFFISHLHSVSDIYGQTPTVEKVQNVLKDKAGFTADDLARLEKGEIIVKQLETKNSGEVAICGVLKLQASRDVVFSAFRRAIEKQRQAVSKDNGIFRNPPVAADLAKLSIDKSDLRSLNNCKVGDCNWSLSSDLIKRLANEIDWSASDADKKASELVKQFMVENLNNYLQKGDGALMEYNDDPEPMSLANEQKSLLDEMLWINDFAPEFKDYLQNFPNGKLNGIEDLATWEKVPVAFKTVIINTHGIFYKKDEGDIQQGFILSKQIYANHYFHSSMSLTGILSFPKPDKTFDTYLFFDSHSRAGALTGTMGKLAKSAVDGEAESKLNAVLKDTKRFTSYENEASQAEPKDGFFKRLVTNKYFIFTIILALVAALIAWFTRKNSTKQKKL